MRTRTTVSMRRARVSAGLLVASLVSAAVVLVLAAPAGAVPTTWSVHCPGDNLQSTINGASSGDTIVVYGTCYGNFTIDNKNDLTLEGGSPRATLNGRGQGSTLTITNGPHYVVENLTITNGNADQGGGLHADDASIAMTNVILSGNVANSGGGIWSRLPYDLVLTGVTITHNIAHGNGGGLYVIGGELRMTASTVSLNQSMISFDGGGGGIWIADVNALLTSTRVTSNTSADFGGGIAAYGGSFTGGAPPIGGTASGSVLLAGGMTLVSSSVDHNRSADDGGGIYNQSQSGDAPLVLQDSAVSFNNATSGDGGGIANYGACGNTASVLSTGSSFQGNGAKNGDGGAIYNAAGGTCQEDPGAALVTMAQSNVSTAPNALNSNTARHGGGFANEQTDGLASLTIQPGVRVTQNKASITGGGVWNDCGSAQVFGANIMLNTPNNVVFTCQAF